MDVPHDAEKPLKIELDPEWLVILKSTNHLINLSRMVRYMPGPGSSERWVTPEYCPKSLELILFNDHFEKLSIIHVVIS